MVDGSVIWSQMSVWSNYDRLHIDKALEGIFENTIPVTKMFIMFWVFCGSKSLSFIH